MAQIKQQNQQKDRGSSSDANTLDQARWQSYLRQSGQTHEMLKIQDLVTNASQENRADAAHITAEQLHASGHSNVTSADIR